MAETMFAVLVKRSDCGDVDVFTVKDSHGRVFWKTFGEARKVMEADYQVMCDEYSPNWTRTGEDVRRHKLERAGAEFSVPVWDGERQCDSRLECKWKVVEI